jgi:rare lipoprotein A
LRLRFIVALCAALTSVTIAAAFANTQTGIASIYSTESGTKTASGARLNPAAFTAAHRFLPFGTKARVTNRKNGRTIEVTINDRGPFVRGRIIDVTPAAARALGFSGLASVTVESDATALSTPGATPLQILRVHSVRAGHPMPPKHVTMKAAKSRCMRGEPMLFCGIRGPLTLARK